MIIQRRSKYDDLIADLIEFPAMEWFYVNLLVMEREEQNKYNKRLN